jgi:ATP-dependent helicase/nuclease subunit B
MYPAEFAEALAESERQLRKMAERVFDGEIAVHPYKLGVQVACERCDFSSVCRFDSWRDPYNLIK